ncbi:MAG: PD-(D/E)XK nuclease family protein [Pseudonocardia sp.]|nr:PD-(D/E)XK nuclease family protein [Pseudonocardia sp.]
MPRKLVKVTPSRLSCWLDCPRRYRMTYLDRPQPSRGGAWAHSTLGAVVHNALRALFDLPVASRTPESAARLVDRHWSGEGFRDAEQIERYRGRARQWVTNYVADLDIPEDPVGVERWVSVPTTRIVAEGRVDRIDEREGQLVVVDYKTGRHAVTEDDARSSQALALYALAVGRTLRRPCWRVELHHLPSGNVIAWEHSQPSLQRHLKRMEETAQDASSATEELLAGGDAERLFPPNPSARCSYCDFRRHCPEGQLAAPDVEPWALLVP